DRRTVQTTHANPTNAKAPNASVANAPDAPMPLRPNQVRRTIALVVDDLGLALDSMAQVHAAMSMYVDEQMQPNDLVAVVRTTADFLREVGNDIEAYREEIFSVGTLGALNCVVKGLRELPGRKSAILFSDGISILKRDAKSERVLESMRRLVDLATRASVVIYTMDARGLQSLEPNTQDNFQGRNGQQIRAAIDDRTAGYFESKNGLNYLAQQTGGI